MSTGNTLGVVPKLLPVTGTFLLPLGLLDVYLYIQCVRVRVETKTLFGRTVSNAPESNPADDPLCIATTAHANFLENVPLVVLMASAVELNGGDRRVLAGVLGLFTAFRVSHSVAMFGGKEAQIGRLIGAVGTGSVIAGMAGWGAWLSRGHWADLFGSN